MGGPGLVLVPSTAHGPSSHGLSWFPRWPGAEGSVCSQPQLLTHRVTAPNSRKGGRARTGDAETEPVWGGDGASGGRSTARSVDVRSHVYLLCPRLSNLWKYGGDACEF